VPWIPHLSTVLHIHQQNHYEVAKVIALQTQSWIHEYFFARNKLSMQSLHDHLLKRYQAMLHQLSAPEIPTKQMDIQLIKMYLQKIPTIQVTTCTIDDDIQQLIVDFENQLESLKSKYDKKQIELRNKFKKRIQELKESRMKEQEQERQLMSLL
jgi:predicted nucleotidyltransferase